MKIKESGAKQCLGVSLASVSHKGGEEAAGEEEERETNGHEGRREKSKCNCGYCAHIVTVHFAEAADFQRSIRRSLVQRVVPLSHQAVTL